MRAKSFDWKSGYWLIGLGLSGSQVNYIKSCVNRFIKIALKKQREELRKKNTILPKGYHEVEEFYNVYAPLKIRNY